MRRPNRHGKGLRIVILVLAAGMFCMPVYAASPDTQAVSAETPATSDETPVISAETAQNDGLTDLLSSLIGKYIAGDLQNRSDLENALEEGQQELGIELSREQKKQICDSVQRIATQGLGSFGSESEGISSNDTGSADPDLNSILGQAGSLSDELDDQIKQAAQKAIQENLVEPVKEALFESLKIAVKDFFTDVKKSLSDFSTQLFHPNAD